MARARRFAVAIGAFALVGVAAVAVAVLGRANPAGTGPTGPTGPSASPCAIATPSTAGATALSEASPSAGSPLGFEPLTLQGRGSTVCEFTIPQDAAAIARIANRGSGTFVVRSLGATGSENELLVSVVGDYAGTVPFDTESDVHSVALGIESDGAWSIVIEPITSARRWSGATPIAGSGADVLIVEPASSGPATLTLAHEGEGTFAIVASGVEGSDLLVDEVGRYSGDVALPEGTTLLEITADGAWAINPR